VRAGSWSGTTRAGTRAADRRGRGRCWGGDCRAATMWHLGVRPPGGGGWRGWRSGFSSSPRAFHPG